jgi:hypothetical protein
MKKYVISLIGIAVFGFASVAGATIYDFTEEGNRLERGYETFVTGVTGGNPMPLGLTITASSTVDDQDLAGTPDNQAFAYMDGTTSGGSGGLGVCGDLRANLTCDPNGDDNQMLGETISILSTIAGNGIIGLTFTGDHGDIVSGTTLKLTLDGTLQDDIDLFSLGADTNHLTYLALTSTAMSLSYEITGSGAQIYLSSLTTVPVPAAVWLFGTALIGFVVLGRRTSVA